jgi:hypothetical protein
MIKTPKKIRTVGILWMIMNLNTLVLFFISYRISLQKYGFMLNAENIAPLFKDFIPGWFLTSLVDIFFLWVASRKYPGQVNIFMHRKERPLWSLFWSILFGLIILSKFLLLSLNLTFGNLIYLPSLMISVYVLGCIRCGVINSNSFRSKTSYPFSQIFNLLCL